MPSQSFIPVYFPILPNYLGVLIILLIFVFFFFGRLLIIKEGEILI